MHKKGTPTIPVGLAHRVVELEAARKQRGLPAEKKLLASTQQKALVEKYFETPEGKTLLQKRVVEGLTNKVTTDAHGFGTITEKEARLRIKKQGRL
jgi:hypothetical protein